MGNRCWLGSLVTALPTYDPEVMVSMSYSYPIGTSFFFVSTVRLPISLFCFYLLHLCLCLLSFLLFQLVGIRETCRVRVSHFLRSNTFTFFSASRNSPC